MQYQPVVRDEGIVPLLDEPDTEEAMERCIAQDEEHRSQHDAWTTQALNLLNNFGFFTTSRAIAPIWDEQLRVHYATLEDQRLG